MIVRNIKAPDTYKDIDSVTRCALKFLFFVCLNKDTDKDPRYMLHYIVWELCRNHLSSFVNLLNKAREMYPLTIDNNHLQQQATTQTDNLELQISIVLQNNFKNGYRLNDTIDKRKFIRLFKENFGQEPTTADNSLDNRIKSCGNVIDNRVYPANLLLSDDIYNKISNFIDRQFDDGVPYLYYCVLFTKFSNDLLNTPITSVDMLKTFLRERLKDKWYFFDEYICNKVCTCADIDEIVVNYVVESNSVVCLEQILKDLWFLPNDQVSESFLKNNKDILITNGRNQKFFIGLFQISAEEEKAISEAIGKYLKEYTCISRDKLIEIVRDTVPIVMTNNSSLSDIGIHNVLKAKLSDKFCFNRSIISALDSSTTISDIVQDFCQSNSKFTIEQLSNIIDTYTDYYLDKEQVLQNSLRIDEHNFVAKTSIGFDVQATDNAIAELMPSSKKYLPLFDVSLYRTLPPPIPNHYIWTPRLLESYLLTTSLRFGLLYDHCLSAKQIKGVIVDKTSEYKDFESVMIDALASSHITLEKQSALNYLADHHYIIRRSYDTIESILIKSRELRNRINNNLL